MDITDCKGIYDVEKRKGIKELLSSEMSMLVRPSYCQTFRDLKRHKRGRIMG